MSYRKSLFLDGDRWHRQVCARGSFSWRAWIFVLHSRFTPHRTEGLRRRCRRGVDVAGRRRCRRARSCMCVWRERRGKRSSARLNRAQHTRTHPPGCYRFSGARILRVIYTHTHTRARASMVLRLVLGFYFFFFVEGFRFFERSRLRCRGEREVLKLKFAVRRDLILSSPWKILRNHVVGRNVLCSISFRYLSPLYYYCYFIFPRSGILWVPTNMCAHKNTNTRVPDRK